MSAVPSAFILVLVEVEVDDLLALEGAAVVLDLLITAWFLVEVLDLDRPAGFCIVLDLVVTFVPGWVVLVVIFDELLLIVAAGAGVVVVAAGVWAKATELPRKLIETRKPKMRFIKVGIGV